MYNFQFQNPTKIYFGMDNFKNLGEVVSSFGNKVLLVYGGGSIKRTGLYDQVIALLEEKDVTVFELGGVEPNPRHTTVNRGVAIVRDNAIDSVLAIGGGSTIDCGKAICATALADTDDVWDLVERKVSYDKALPLTTVVTIAATGSEMDAGAVISNIDLNQKRGIGSPVIRPRVTFEVPEFTYSVPKYQTACGSVDIMAHVFDVAYFTKQDDMFMLKGMREQVLRTVVKFAPIAYNDPENYEARANLMWASTWALNSFMSCGIRQNTACHAMEHELSAYYDITHGHGLAILIPRWLRYILNEETKNDIYRFGINVMGIESELDAMEGSLKAIEALETLFFDTLGLQSHLSDLGITDEKFEEMAQNCTKNGAIKSIMDLEEKDVVEIYRMCA